MARSTEAAAPGRAAWAARVKSRTRSSPVHRARDCLREARARRLVGLTCPHAHPQSQAEVEAEAAHPPANTTSFPPTQNRAAPPLQVSCPPTRLPCRVLPPSKRLPPLLTPRTMPCPNHHIPRNNNNNNNNSNSTATLPISRHHRPRRPRKMHWLRCKEVVS